MPEHYKLKKLKVPLILWSIVTTFFAFQFILRLSAGILREDIIKKIFYRYCSFWDSSWLLLSGICWYADSCRSYVR